MSSQTLRIGLCLALLFTCADAFRKKAPPKDGQVRSKLVYRAQSEPSLVENRELLLDRTVARKAEMQAVIDRAIEAPRHWWPMDGWLRNVGQVSSNTNTIQTVGSQVTAQAGNIASNAGVIANLGTTAASNAVGVAANSQSIATIGNLALTNAAGVASNAGAISTLGAGVAANSASIAGVVGSVTMLSGTVAANSGAIASLSAQVAVLGQAAGPTIALANALGVSVGTVATVSLAGSLMAPVLGCMMLVYVCWPDEKNDPWWKMEERVAQMINDKFSKVRRKRLTHRLKRYVKEFSTCSTAWIEQHAKPHAQPGSALLDMSSTMHSALHNISKYQLAHFNEPSMFAEADLKVGATTEPPEFSPEGRTCTPPCMEQLDMHMSLERDEWMSTEKGSIDGLFMPFANMHTQIQSLLASYECNFPQKWVSAEKATSAAYAAFMLEHLLDAWSSQMCRTVRLRYEWIWGVRYRYKFLVLSPVWQPHAGEDCWEASGAKSGWSNYCGGKGVGACCKAGAALENPPKDPSECKQFDIPVSGWRKRPYHTCVHTDCQQANSDYKGELLAELDGVADWAQCQEYCKSFEQHESVFPFKKKVVFSMHAKGDSFGCKCLTGDLTRFYSHGVVSGPIECREPEVESASQQEEEEKHLASVPMEETSPCSQSPDVSNLPELELHHTDWMKNCLANVTKLVTDEYNPFFKRFAQFIDKLAFKAGCSSGTSDEKEDFTVAGDKFDHSSWDQCDWQEEKDASDDAWNPDRERHTGGWFGHNQIDLQEQAKVTLKYPLPQWLQKRKAMMECLQAVGSGDGDQDTDRGAAESNILNALEPTATE